MKKIQSQRTDLNPDPEKPNLRRFLQRAPKKTRKPIHLIRCKLTNLPNNPSRPTVRLLRRKPSRQRRYEPPHEVRRKARATPAQVMRTMQTRERLQQVQRVERVQRVPRTPRTQTTQTILRDRQHYHPGLTRGLHRTNQQVTNQT
jgi:hypothetical protein